MENDYPTDPGQEGSDVLAMEAARLARGVEFKRLIRAAAAFRDLFDDRAIAAAVHRSRNTVGSWWTGSVPEPSTLGRLADATGLDPDELYRYVYRGGPLPHLVEPGSPAAEAIAAGLRDQSPGAADRRQLGRLPPPRPGGIG